MVDKKPDIREIMADYDKAVEFFANTPAEAWEQIGVGTAMKVFEDTVGDIKVYRQFLADRGIDPKKVKTFGDFKGLPLTDKYNYIQKHGFEEVNTAKPGQNLYSLSLSSGTVDEPTIWPRYYEYEEFLPLVYDLFLRQYWQIDKKSTLVINAFSMGPWIAGFSVYQGIRPLTQKYNLTQVTTGADIESIVHTVTKIGKNYDQVLLFSYPTFTRSVIDRLEACKVDFKKLNFKLWIAGEGHTVEWRQYINKLITGNEKNLTTIIDGYGVTDAGLVGMGSALTNLIRDLAYSDKKLCQALFGTRDDVPSLFQYNPATYFIEEDDNEVVFTTASTTPLVRYNIKDRGGVIPFRKMEKTLVDHGYKYKEIFQVYGLSGKLVWQQPFVYCFGRQSDTISIVGALIAPEQIAPALINDKVKGIHSFKIAIVSDKKQHSRFCVMIELMEGEKCSRYRTSALKRRYRDLVLERLLRVNLDFADSYRIDRKICNPKIEIYPFGAGPFENDLGRTKPRLVVKN